jgi:sterol regulatory element-binding transcription factor 1
MLVLSSLDDKNSPTGEREHATSLYLQCRHLPAPLLGSTPGERAGMLTEAAKALEKVGDKHKMEECYRLMRGISQSTVQAG